MTVLIHAAHLELTTALANGRTLKSEILPQSETVLQATEARYAAGDIGLSEVLLARRERALLQLDYLQSLRDAMQAKTEILAYLNSAQL